MNYRRLGRTGLEVSEVGFGAWGIGGELWRGSDDRESIDALKKAASLGVNFVDTALAYGDGHSERLIAKLLKEQKGGVYVATKIPPKNREWPAKPSTKLRDAFPAKYVVECTEKSLKNLSVDRIDIQQFHVWNDDWANDNEWRDVVEKLKEQQKIRFFGISINDHQPENALKAAETGKIDTFQVIYNIFDQSPEEKLFPLCVKLDIGIIVRVPFDEGSLTGSVTLSSEFDRRDFRRDYFRGDRKAQVVERTEKLKSLLGSEASTLSELALRFCLDSNAVSTVIPGMRKIKNVENNCANSDGRKLSDTMVEELRRHQWKRNFYD